MKQYICFLFQIQNYILALLFKPQNLWHFLFENCCFWFFGGLRASCDCYLWIFLFSFPLFPPMFLPLPELWSPAAYRWGRAQEARSELTWRCSLVRDNKSWSRIGGGGLTAERHQSPNWSWEHLSGGFRAQVSWEDAKLWGKECGELKTEWVKKVFIEVQELVSMVPMQGWAALVMRIG